MPYFAELDKDNVVVSVLESKTRPDYAAAGKTAVDVSDFSFIGGHYNGATIDKCPAGKMWNATKKKFVKIPAV